MTTTTATLTDFLLARIAEDEAAAEAARADALAFESVPNYAKLGFSAGNLAHRHDPARVLAECKAHRAIVEALGWHRMVECRCDDDPRCDGWKCSLCSRRWPCESSFALRALAAIWADYEAYRDEWPL